jgi:poly(3-hydroxybutyrate) depolymerase
MGRLTLVRPQVRQWRGVLFALPLVAWFVATETSVLLAQGPRLVQRRAANGFVTRIFKDAAGQHKYVLFVPQAYNASKRWPVILYLHGAGERGTDGVLQTTVGLGPYVRERAATFPFFVVFPQAEDTQGRILTEWSPTSPDGKRALAILDSVEREFAIDGNHRVLSGWSMGGYGTWSIGAAEPKHWSALVPVAGGGDPAWASSLKEVPIWAFQGATDTVVPPSAARPLIDAIRKAGGHPLYNEIPDVGHDVWKVAYGDNHLYEWMLAPSTKPLEAAATSSPNAAVVQPRARRPIVPAEEGPFVPAVTIPHALYVRLGNDAIRALANSAPRLIPPNALAGRINDIASSTSTSGYTFGVQFSGITYSAQLDRVWAKAYAKDLLNIQLGLRNVTLVIGTTYVSGSGRSAVAGPIYVVVGNRYPIWLSFDVTPYVLDGKLRLQLVGTHFEIPNDDWYVTPPYGVSVSGLGMTQERVSSGLVEGIYGQKSRIEQEAAQIVPSLLPMFEQRLAFEDVTQAASAIWPLPVYRPRLRVSPSSVEVDEKGISFVMDVTAAAADPRKAPETPREERPAGITLDSVPQDTELRLGIAPNILAPLTRMLIDEGVARVNVLDIPDNKFAVFADRKALADVLPDVASLPPNTEINADLVLSSPVEVRDAQSQTPARIAAATPKSQKPGQPIRVTALKANAADPIADPAPKSPAGSASGPRPFEFVVPKAVIEISVRDSQSGGKWKPYAELNFDLTQTADASVLRREFAERALRIAWTGEPSVKASARFASSYTPKNSEIRTDKLRDLFTSAWRTWTQNGSASAVPVPDVDLGYAKLRLDGVQWSPPAISVLFDEPGVKITNTSNVDLVYETKDLYSRWSEPYRLKPGKSDEFKVFDPLIFRRVVGDQFVQNYTLPIGSHCEFRAGARGGPPDLFQISPRPLAESK